MNKTVYVLMNGINLNHSNERYRFKATSDTDEAEVLILGLENQKQPIIYREDEDENDAEYGNAWTKITTSCPYVYVIWLNELSRIYAGNEIMGVFDNFEVAKKNFHEQWAHQTERWDFNDEEAEGETTEPEIEDNENEAYSLFWRCNGGDCEQTIGIAKIKVDSNGWLTCH